MTIIMNDKGDREEIGRAPQVGDFVKVTIPYVEPDDDGCEAETPWAEVTSVVSPTSFIGRIDNHITGTQYHYGDQVIFVQAAFKEGDTVYEAWVPSEEPKGYDWHRLPTEA